MEEEVDNMDNSATSTQLGMEGMCSLRASHELSASVLVLSVSLLCGLCEPLVSSLRASWEISGSLLRGLSELFMGAMRASYELSARLL